MDREVLIRYLRVVIWISFVLIEAGAATRPSTSDYSHNRYLEALRHYGPGDQFYKYLPPPYTGFCVIFESRGLICIFQIICGVRRIK